MTELMTNNNITPMDIYTLAKSGSTKPSVYPIASSIRMAL